MATIDVKRLIDDGPFRPLQRIVAVLCFFAVMVDGFDTQVIGYLAPSLAADWHLSKAVLAPVFSSGLIGLMLGALIFGPLADKWGRKPILILSVAAFGLLSIATAGAASVNSLLVLRFLTGLGLGGVMPNAIALTSEYAPARIRATVVMIMFCGFSLGAVLGGLVSASLVSHYSWRAVFVVGGAGPLLLTPFLFRSLPESLQFLHARGARAERLMAVLRRMLGGAGLGPEAVIEMPHEQRLRFPLITLFSDGRGLLTVMLWVIFFASLFELYFVANWLPILLHEGGIDVRHAVVISSLFQGGGTIGTLLLGRLIDRHRPFVVLAATYLCAAGFLGLIGAFLGGNLPAMMAAVFGAGFCIVGGQIGANAMAARAYPTAMRATGVGWALGIGRIGSIIGPVLGGAFLSLQWAAASVLWLGIIPVVAAACAALVIHVRRSRGVAAAVDAGVIT